MFGSPLEKFNTNEKYSDFRLIKYVFFSDSLGRSNGINKLPLLSNASLFNVDFNCMH